MITKVSPEVMTRVETQVRLRGYVSVCAPEKRYGFITVPGLINPVTGQLQQYHFHPNSLRSRTGIAVGVVVEFTPLSLPPEARAMGKRDKATDIAVVG